MQLPLPLTFQGIEPSAAVEAAVRQKVNRLERFDSGITSCRVAVELLQKHTKAPASGSAVRRAD